MRHLRAFSDNARANLRLSALQGIVQHYDDGKKILRDKQGELSKAAARAAKAVKEGNDKIEDLRAKLETVKEDERARQKAIDVAQRTLDQLQKKIDKKPAEPDFSEVNARMVSLLLLAHHAGN